MCDKHVVRLMKLINQLETDELTLSDIVYLEDEIAEVCDRIKSSCKDVIDDRFYKELVRLEHVK